MIISWISTCLGYKQLQVETDTCFKKYTQFITLCYTAQIITKMCLKKIQSNLVQYNTKINQTVSANTMNIPYMGKWRNSSDLLPPPEKGPWLSADWVGGWIPELVKAVRRREKSFAPTMNSKTIPLGHPACSITIPTTTLQLLHIIQEYLHKLTSHLYTIWWPELENKKRDILTWW